MRGVRQVRPGWWQIDPVAAGPRSGLGALLKHFSGQAKLEERLAAIPEKPFAATVDNAIAEAEAAGQKFTAKPATRLLLNVSPSGTRADAALAYDLDEAHDVYDFPKGTSYIKWVGAPVAGRGREAIRIMQEEEGPLAVLQAWLGGGHDNVAKYQQMGFQHALPNSSGRDALGGHKSLPAMEIFKPVRMPREGAGHRSLVRMADGDLIEKTLFEPERGAQMAFPDFKRGGLARLRSRT